MSGITLRQGSTGSTFNDLFCQGLTGESTCEKCGGVTRLGDVKTSGFPDNDNGYKIRLTFSGCGCGNWSDTYLSQAEINNQLGETDDG